MRVPRGVADGRVLHERDVAVLPTIPGVQSAAGVTFLPMAGLGIGTGFHRLDRPTPNPGDFPVHRRSPGHVRLLQDDGYSAAAGRYFTPADAADAPLVAVISDDARIDAVSWREPARASVSTCKSDATTAWMPEIVGVVGDIKFVSLDTETRNAIYMPHTQRRWG